VLLSKFCDIFLIVFCPLQIIYIDHLDFPVEQLHCHVFDYSALRALHVCNDDFELAISIDRNKKKLDI
jgi:hypothetical protein